MVFLPYTLWLFNRSDLKTVVFPQMAFGVFSALSGTRLTTNAAPTIPEVAARLPRLAFWVWSNLLLETIANQRLPSSVIEDSVNKPWRPLPSARLTPLQARRLLVAMFPLVSIASFFLGGLQETMALQAFSFIYNDLDGANRSFIIRNILNAGGIACFSIGASKVATGYPRHTINQRAYIWTVLLSTVISSTVHTQDLADMEGDRRRARRTIPLLYGEDVARWSIAVMVTSWSILCPLFWRSNVFGCFLTLGVGCCLSVCVTRFRNIRADEIAWQSWCAWMMVLYSLPLL